MVKSIRKTRQNQNDTINSVLTVNNPTPKSKQQIDKEHYRKNKEGKKEQRKERHAKQKGQVELSVKQTQDESGKQKKGNSSSISYVKS